MVIFNNVSRPCEFGILADSGANTARPAKPGDVSRPGSLPGKEAILYQKPAQAVMYIGWCSTEWFLAAEESLRVQHIW